ncbi:capsular exopolysaccharide family protein [Enterococcus faecium EnGen0263]|uniref:CpsD/CapB family tyrosine-protein kinase n=1 Tax=Enterococcus faecium TaxID=1352 RepID=UPI00032F60ED|nr:CpsD/CapB family tyrosine-protein kinase [Enterococcus faecium]EOH52850.1 capsular exopolysaccharide family protein [Enterococcus faecium EnGen0263]
MWKTKKKIKRCALIAQIDANDICSEQYRSIKANIDFLYKHEKNCHFMMFTSARPSEGKSTCTANMAVTFARTNKKILLVDGDIRRSTVHETFNLPNSWGLSSFLNGRIAFEDAVYPTKIDNLDVIPSGPNTNNPSELFNSTRFDELLETASKIYDFVIFDTPPVLGMADSKVLATKLKDIVLVVRDRKTTNQDIDTMAEQLMLVNANILGVVYSGEKTNNKSNYQYY